MGTRKGGKCKEPVADATGLFASKAGIFLLQQYLGFLEAHVVGLLVQFQESLRDAGEDDFLAGFAGDGVGQGDHCPESADVGDDLAPDVVLGRKRPPMIFPPAAVRKISYEKQAQKPVFIQLEPQGFCLRLIHVDTFMRHE